MFPLDSPQRESYTPFSQYCEFLSIVGEFINGSARYKCKDKR